MPIRDRVPETLMAAVAGRQSRRLQRPNESIRLIAHQERHRPHAAIAPALPKIRSGTLGHPSASWAPISATEHNINAGQDELQLPGSQLPHQIG